MTIKIRGMHGTCRSAATDILAKGMLPANVKQRAGSGMYFWAYDFHGVRAKALARAWWQYKFSRNHYVAFKDKSFALLKLELDIEEEELLDLDAVKEQDNLLHLEQRLIAKNGGGNVNSYDLYTTYVQVRGAQLSSQTPPVQLRVLKAMLPPPDGFPYSPAHLTSAVNGYIVLAGAVGRLSPSALSIIN